MTGNVELARQWAALYRLRGLQPLPSRTDAKRPMVRFAQWWESDAPADLFEQHETTNIQVMTGRHWRLLVIDLDGPEAIERFNRLGQVPRTWQTHSGGAGRHVWFRLPASMPDMPKAFLWKGEGEHQAIERLCDRSLVMAPPSIHPTTGKRYQFVAGLPNPTNSMPAPAPAWVLNLKPIVTAPVFLPANVTPVRRTERPVGRYQRDDVLASVNVRAVAASWGVRFAGGISPKGWMPCHAIGREDRTASAAIHAQTGQYVDQGTGTRMSLFDLGAALGVYEDWRHTLEDLGARYAIRSA